MFIAGATILFSSCDPNKNQEVTGWKPVYLSAADMQKIDNQSPKPIVNAGKIYIKDYFLFQIETGEGIHVIDLSTPSDPKKITFIRVPGAQEISIIGNNLYTNNFNDLVILNINEIEEVKVVNRIAGTFNLLNSEIPPETGYFECIDNSKGIVTGWQKTLLKDPQCRY